MWDKIFLALFKVLSNIEPIPEEAIPPSGESALNMSDDAAFVNLEYKLDTLNMRVSPNRSSDETTEKSTIDCSP